MTEPRKYQEKNRYRRIDPIFHLQTPLLFAHRGGALEVPESTKKAFKYAQEEAGADILELDVQLTRDGEFVVWHGPSLDNVFIQGVDPDPSKRPEKRRMIYDFDWHELEGKAWVADPGEADLMNVPQDEERELLLLSEFLKAFPDKPLNIEMKSSFKRKIRTRHNTGLRHNISEFLKMLNIEPRNRIIVVVSAKHIILKEFRNQSKGRYPTNLSCIEQLVFPFSNRRMDNRALETTYCISGIKQMIHKVRKLGGSTFVFLTAFWPIPSIDENPQEKDVFGILDHGVDGIMTDRPKRIRKIMDQWINQ